MRAAVHLRVESTCFANRGMAIVKITKVDAVMLSRHPVAPVLMDLVVAIRLGVRVNVEMCHFLTSIVRHPTDFGGADTIRLLDTFALV